MKKTIFNISLFAIIAMAVLNSCSGDGLDDMNSHASTKAMKGVCMEWGAALDMVNESMTGYTLCDISDDFMKFLSSEDGHVISYQFDETGLLCASALCMEEQVASLDNILKGYVHVGNLDGSEMYLNEEKGICAATYVVVSDEVDYRVVGFTHL